MKIYKVTWTEIDWNALYCLGYNYTIASGEEYYVNKADAENFIENFGKKGEINITEIEVK